MYTEVEGESRFPCRWPTYRCLLPPVLKTTALSVSAPQDSLALATAEPTGLLGAGGGAAGSVKVEPEDADWLFSVQGPPKPGSSLLPTGSSSCPESQTCNLKMFSKLSSK